MKFINNTIIRNKDKINNKNVILIFLLFLLFFFFLFFMIINMEQNDKKRISPLK